MNKVILHGRLGQDPEIINTQNGKKIAKFSLATSEKYKEETKTQWHNIVVFGKVAEIAEKHFKKGQELIVEGKIEYRQHEGKYYTDIIMNSFSFCGSGKSDNNPNTNKGYNPDEDPNSPKMQEQEDYDDLPY